MTGVVARCRQVTGCTASISTWTNKFAHDRYKLCGTLALACAAFEVAIKEKPAGSWSEK